MKTKLMTMCLVAAVLAIGSAAAWADPILYLANNSKNRIETYNPLTGAAINTSFITGLNNPWGITLYGDTLYVSSFGQNAVKGYNALTGNHLFSLDTTASTTTIDVTVGGDTLYVLGYGTGSKVKTFDAATGAALNTSFITANLWGGQGIDVDNGLLYGAMNGDASVRTWNAASGAVSSSRFASTASWTQDVEIAGDTMYVSASNKVQTFNPDTGASLNSSFIPAHAGASYLAVSDGVLYVTGDSVKAYNAATGAAISGFTPISTGDTYRGVAVTAVPEPATLAILGLGALGLLRRKK